MCACIRIFPSIYARIYTYTRTHIYTHTRILVHAHLRMYPYGAREHAHVRTPARARVTRGPSYEGGMQKGRGGSGYLGAFYKLFN